MSVIIQIRDTFYGLDLQPASDVRRHTLEKNRSFFSIHENYLIKNWFHWHFEMITIYGRTIGIIIIIDLLLTVQSFIHFVRHDSLTCQTKFKKTYFEFWDEIFFLPQIFFWSTLGVTLETLIIGLLYASLQLVELLNVFSGLSCSFFRWARQCSPTMLCWPPTSTLEVLRAADQLGRRHTLLHSIQLAQATSMRPAI